MFLNLNQLRSFYTAAKAGSITRAADELMVTPAAVTFQVKQFEEHLGINLLFRAGNSMRLTPSGATVFERVQKIFEDIKNLETFIADLSKIKSGAVKIGCSETAAISVMPGLIKVFKQTYPDIKVIIDRGTNADMVSSLLDHQNELLIVRYRSKEKRFKMRHMGRKEILLVAVNESDLLPQHNISIGELSKVPLIVPLNGSATREIVRDHLKRFKVYPKVVMESSSIALIMRLVREDEGVSFLCRDVVEEELSKGILKEIHLSEGALFIEYGIGYLNRNNLSRASLAFLRLIEKSKDLL
jgi:DNA-binding transcriptional LysR family regulator